MPSGEKRGRPPENLPVVSETEAPERKTPAVDEAGRFHDLVLDWLELARDYKEQTGESWKAVREKAAAPVEKLEDKVKAIRIGRVETLPIEAKPKIEEERVAAIKERLRILDSQIAELKSRAELKPKTRELFQAERRFQEVGRELDALRAYHDSLDTKEFQLLKKRRGKLTSVDKKLLQESAEIHQALANRQLELATSPETAWPARLRELLRYRDGLAKERFAETPSRRRYLEEIHRLWEEGKNVFLSGPTGTGKTELFQHLGKNLYGEPPEIVRGSERVGASEIFGKTLLKATPAGGTETYFQPGRYTEAIDKGKPLIFDEFNLLDPKARLQLKELYNRRSGDRVTVQEDSGQPHAIQEGFFFGATANIKGEKHKERFELDPAESRVFEMRRVDYLPKEELYDLCLAKLMDKRGGVNLSAKDAAATLKVLAEAAEMIQGAYLGTQTAIYEAGAGAKKKYATLEKAVLDPGRVLGMLEGWPVAQAKGASFKEYLNDRLRDFLNQEDFEKDRPLLLKILVTKGFFQGRKSEEFHLPGLKTKDLETWGWKAQAEAPRPAAYLRPEEVARLDPFGARQGKIAAIGAEFLAEAPSVERPSGAEGLESELRFVVTDAVNPYRETFLEGGITDPALTAERQDRELDLLSLLEEDRDAYAASDLPDWAAALANIRNDIRLTPDKRAIIEQEIKDGAIAILMPGRATQQATALEQYKNNLKPIWIKDGAAQSLSEAYMWEHTASLIQNQNPQLTKDIPDRPYLLLIKPTQTPEARTTNKTVNQQKQEFTKINQERQKNSQTPAHVTSPLEYAATQKRFTESARNQSTQPLTNLRPLDSATWSRFIDLPLSSGGDVPGGDFSPVDRQVRFGGGDATSPNAIGGFRLSVRVEL